VAATAGVSRSTASRVINGGHLVSEQARHAVEAAIEALGFAPNSVARSLATRRTHAVALVVPEPDLRVFSDPFFGSIINGLSLSLERNGLQLAVVIARRGRSEHVLRRLTTGRVDGAVLISHRRCNELDRELIDSGLPCVFQGRPVGVVDVPYVDTDNVGGARLATEHLVRNGHRRIGTVAGPVDLSAGVDRLTGWRHAMAEAGLPSDAVEHGDFTEAGGAAATRRLLDRSPGLDAIFVASDRMASAALTELAARGRRVPEDVAVFGYDDFGIAVASSPRLSTVVNPVAAMGERAGEMLIELLERGTLAEQRVIMPTQLVLRESA
jgi:DNA-binding LacI/PurR family transcriptional regulator